MIIFDLQLKNQLVIVLCNLKHSKLRGVISEAMVLCAYKSDSIELLNPPGDSKVGDKVIVEGCDGEPVKEINSKNKVFEKIKLDLNTNEECVAIYKQKPLTVLGKGFIKCKTLRNANIK